jgi:hypothetical protein
VTPTVTVGRIEVLGLDAGYVIHQRAFPPPQVLVGT